MADSRQSETPTQKATPAPRTEAEAPPQGLAALKQQLYQVATSEADKSTAVDRFSQMVMQLTNAVGVVYFERISDDQLSPLAEIDVADLLANEVHCQRLGTLCQQAIRARSLQVDFSREDHGVTIVCLPVMKGDRDCDVLVTYLLLGNEPLEPFVVTLELVASYVTLWHTCRETERLDWENRTTAALMELLDKTQSCEDMQAACFVVANELKKFLGCQRVALGLKRRRATGCRLTAVSGIPEFDRQARPMKVTEAALNEAVVRNDTTRWPAENTDERRAALAHRQLADLIHAEVVISSPLKDNQGEIVGAWCISGDESTVGTPIAINTIEAAAPLVATSLSAVSRAQRSHIGKVVHGLVNAPKKWKAKTVLICLLVTVGVLFVPIPFKIRCGATLEPMMRRFAVAPYTGLLKKPLVETGDTVSKGDVLAVMDGKELRWELAGIAADRNRAAKQRDVSQSADDIPEAQMAQLEFERLVLQTKLLEYRQQNLEIRSPLDGFVMASNIDNAEKLPVQVGQPLLEIAPLDQIKLMVHVPADEIAHVNTGDIVKLRLDAYPDENYMGEIAKVRPRSEIVETENVFIAEVILQNDEQRLRPGMDGRAKVSTGRRAFGWILFHKAWEGVVGFLGWK